MANFCFKCGSPVDEDSVFCSNCGTRLKEAAPANPEGSLINPALPVVTEYDNTFDKSPLEEVIGAAGQGNVAAIYELGERYRLGIDGAEEDQVKAIGLYKDVLKYQNNRKAFYHIGYMLVDGVYGEERAKEGLQYYDAAFRLKSSTAASQLAILYEYGHLVPKDLDRALYYLDKAIEFGNGNGTEYVDKARVYERLGKIEQSRQCLLQALENYDKQIRNGEIDDLSWVWHEKGRIYRNLHDYLMAKECYEKSLSFGNNPSAATNLAAIYEDGIPGKMDVDLDKALYYYQLAYDTKHDDDQDVISINMLGLFYFHDKAGKGKDDKAFDLFKEVNELGSNISNLCLGYYYGTGIPGHVDIDTDLAFELLDDVPEEDIPTALYYKGLIYLKTLHNEQSARTYLEASAQRGEEMAISLLKKLDNNKDDPMEFVNRSEALFDEGDLQGAVDTITEGFHLFPDNLAVLRQLVRMDDRVLIGRGVLGALNSSEKEFCYMVLDMVKKLRDNSYELEGLDSTESNLYYCLGCIYFKEEDFDTALRMLSSSNVDDTPETAWKMFHIHIHNIEEYLNELYQDASRLRQALTSENWHTDTDKAYAYLGLSTIYAVGAPGINTDINYAYDCIQRCNALDPDVAKVQIGKYSRDRYGRIIYDPSK